MNSLWLFYTYLLLNFTNPIISTPLPDFERSIYLPNEGISIYKFHSIFFTSDPAQPQRQIPSSSLQPHIGDFHELYTTTKSLATYNGAHVRPARFPTPPSWHFQIGRARLAVETEDLNNPITWGNVNYVAARSLRDAEGAPVGSTYTVDVSKVVSPSAANPGTIDRVGGQRLGESLKGRITVSLDNEYSNVNPFAVGADEGGAASSEPVHRPVPIGVGGRMPPVNFGQGQGGQPAASPEPQPEPARLRRPLSGVD